MALAARYRGNLDVYLQSLQHLKSTLSPTGVLTKALLHRCSGR
jgi:hypothetical protein